MPSKIELVARLDALEERVEALDDLVTGSHQVIADRSAPEDQPL